MFFDLLRDRSQRTTDAGSLSVILRAHVEANDAEPKQHPPNRQGSWTSCPEVAADSSSPVWLDQNNGRRGRPALARAAPVIVGNLGRYTAVGT